MIAAGGAHSIALTDKNNVYSCGHNADGQLGLNDEKSRVVWTHVTALAGKRATRIYAGGSHSWAVLDQNRPVIDDY